MQRFLVTFLPFIWPMVLCVFTFFVPVRWEYYNGAHISLLHGGIMLGGWNQPCGSTHDMKPANATNLGLLFLRGLHVEHLPALPWSEGSVKCYCQASQRKMKSCNHWNAMEWSNVYLNNYWVMSINDLLCHKYKCCYLYKDKTKE